MSAKLSENVSSFWYIFEMFEVYICKNVNNWHIPGMKAMFIT